MRYPASVQSNSSVAKPTRIRGRKETGHGAGAVGGIVQANHQRPIASRGAPMAKARILCSGFITSWREFMRFRRLWS